MYFSLQENGTWFFCGGANDSSYKDPNLCNGPLLVYVGDPQNPNDSKIYEEFEDEVKWLSAKSECFWFGLYCNKDMTVQMIEIVELFGTAHFFVLVLSAGLDFKNFLTPVTSSYSFSVKTILLVHFWRSSHLLLSLNTLGLS
jgi:hypothetical protein